MNLVVDVGNSRVKWAFVRGAELLDGAALDREGPLETALAAAFAVRTAPHRVLVCSVADAALNQRLANWMRQYWGRDPEWFRCAPRTLGLVNAYAEPAQLGVDRWAALLGARARQAPPLAVIDCGTAMTVDVVDATDHHLGGLIAPGLELARRNLLTNTARVRAVAAHDSGWLGRDTAACVASGTGLGVDGTLERWVREVDRRVPGVTWLATGGGWRAGPQSARGPIVYDPDLVLKGLARLLE